MFHGSVPAQMRGFVSETVSSWNTSDLWVGCSGNFTLERCLPDYAHHGNDVTLYSSVLGWWASGSDIPVTLKPDSEEQLGWLAPYLVDRDDLLATVLLATRFFSSVGKSHPYHRRQVQAHRDQWEQLHAKTAAKVQASSLKLVSYHCKDVREWLETDVPPDAPVLSFPPFFGGDYENMFQPLADHFDWPEPSYSVLDEEGKQDLIQLVQERPSWLLGLHIRHPDLEPHLKGVVQTTNRGVPIYLYASGGPKRVVSPSQKSEPVLVSRLSPADVLTGDEMITIHPLTGGQFATLRSQYMNPNIRPGNPLLAVAVKADGKIIGCLAFSTPQYDPHMAYMLSDFPAAPVNYKRLAALIVRIGQSTEVQHLLQRSLNRRITQVRTTAFSNNPVSMKYRTGKMTLEKRDKAPDGNHEFMLNYVADAGRWTAQDAYRDWHKNHAKHVEVQ